MTILVDTELNKIAADMHNSAHFTGPADVLELLRPGACHRSTGLYRKPCRRFEVPRSICFIPDCDKFVVGFGLCNTHYARQKRTGSPYLKPKVVKLCAVEGCQREARARGWCNNHWHSWRAYGDPTISRGVPLGTGPRLIAEALASDTDECVTWPLAVDGSGYGQITLDGQHIHVHVVVCERAHGLRPTPKHEVRHLCGKGHLACINPRHLRWGTRKENHADKLVHGTMRMGETFPTARLLNDEVGEIRRRLARGERPKDLGVLFGVDDRLISAIKRGRSYRRIGLDA